MMLLKYRTKAQCLISIVEPLIMELQTWGRIPPLCVRALRVKCSPPDLELNSRSIDRAVILILMQPLQWEMFNPLKIDKHFRRTGAHGCSTTILETMRATFSSLHPTHFHKSKMAISQLQRHSRFCHFLLSSSAWRKLISLCLRVNKITFKGKEYSQLM